MDVPPRRNVHSNYGYNHETRRPEQQQVPYNIYSHDQTQRSGGGRSDMQNQSFTGVRNFDYHHQQHLQPSSASASAEHRNSDRFGVQTSPFMTNTSNPNHCTGRPPTHPQKVKNCDRYVQKTADTAFKVPNYHPERAQGLRIRRDSEGSQKISYDKRIVNYAKKDELSNTNYIKPDLVQKVLERQRRAQTPVVHLHDRAREVSGFGGCSAGKNIVRIQKPEHHLSDVSLSYKMADCRVNDPDSVSTESQRESGYQSGESIGDRSSATSDNVELNQTALWMSTTTASLTQQVQAPPGTPSFQCEYLVRGDQFFDLYNEQERLGNMDQALTYLNQAIDCFQRAMDASSTSLEDVLRIRLKHNKAVLCQRRLLKQTKHAGGASRRLPHLPQENIKTPSSDRQSATNKYSKEPIGADCFETRNRSNTTVQVFWKDSVGDVREKCGKNAGHYYRPDTEGQWTTDDVKDIKLYATLPKKNKKGHLMTEESACILQNNDFPMKQGNCPTQSGCFESNGLNPRTDRLPSDQGYFSNRQLPRETKLLGDMV